MKAPPTPRLDVHEESFDDVLEDMVRLLGSTREHVVTPQRFRWLYRQNPDGPAVIWSLRDSETGQMAGFTACLPRRIVADGQVRNGWNGADFSIDPSYRTLGPAIKLRRAARLAIDEGRVDLLYAHPNERMAVIHSRVGHRPAGTMCRLARPLAITPYIADRFGSNALVRGTGRLIEPIWRLWGRETWYRTASDVALVESIQFDNRFDELFERYTNSHRFAGVRDSQYLNWRYADCPLYQTDALLAERNGRLIGYVLFVVRNGMANIKDIFPPDPKIAADLLCNLARIGREKSLRSMSVSLLEQNPLFETFQRLGFRPRAERSQMFAYCSPDSPWHAELFDPASWFVTVGDRDV